MSTRRLFLSHTGRITRRQWWTATLLLLVISRALSGVTAGFTSIPRRDLIVTLIMLNFWLAPAYAVSAKRFQDRNKSGVTALYGLGPHLITTLVIMYAVIYDWSLSPTVSVGCDVVGFAVDAWFIVELGMLKGTRGPNRFGKDPLDPAQPADVIDDGRYVSNSLFAYTVSAGGAVIMVMACNAFVQVLSFPAVTAVYELVRRNTHGCCEATDPRFVASVTLIAAVLAWSASCLAAPFARLALRTWPVDPFGRRTFRGWTLMTLSLMCLAAVTISVWFTFQTLLGRSVEATLFGLTERPYYNPRTSMEVLLSQAVVSFSWRSILMAITLIFIWAHVRARQNLNRPFALFLRRFSTFADGALVVDLIKSMPRNVPLVFIASRDDQARNWDPFVWAFGGLRLVRPLKNLPMQIKTKDAGWTDTVEALVGKAQCVIIDVSERSASIETEWQLIYKVGAQERVAVLANARSVAAADLRRDFPSAIPLFPEL